MYLILRNRAKFAKFTRIDSKLVRLKSDSHLPKKGNSPSKMMKNTFYFILKALFILKIFKFFVLTFWAFRKNGLIRKITLISKFMRSQPG